MDEKKIPVIDFSKEELKPGAASWVSTRQAVCHALEDYGCFVATLVSDSDQAFLDLRSSLFGALDKLFDFPKQVKSQNKYDKPFRGYHSPNPIHEGLGIDNPINPQQNHNFSKLFWPNGNNEFRYTYVHTHMSKLISIYETTTELSLSITSIYLLVFVYYI